MAKRADTARRSVACTGSISGLISGPDFTFEARAIEDGHRFIAGIDEAGRGPWAGPVVAAAVILDPASIPDGLDDSKALSPAKRDTLFAGIHASGAIVAVGIADVRRIDRINILQATFWAMQKAVSGLARVPSIAFVDGNRAPRLPMPARTIVGGDALSVSIAAASIIAKVTRDRMMIELAQKYPGYGFDLHKGYGTPAHHTALMTLGPCAEHRRSFRPVELALAAMQNPLRREAEEIDAQCAATSRVEKAPAD